MSAELSPELEAKFLRLKSILTGGRAAGGEPSITKAPKASSPMPITKASSPIIVAFSGGVDSALLARVAADVCEHALAVTAVSPSLGSRDLQHCASLAEKWNIRWQKVETHEMESDKYRKNDLDRCYWCKDALMDALLPLAHKINASQCGGEHVDTHETKTRIALGVNCDDLGDHRPGIKAAAEGGAIFPLVEAGLTKSDIRRLSAHLGLETWDRPAAPCLASRIPYGTAVSPEILSKVERAENIVRKMGFAELRVRHYGETARIEVPKERISELQTKEPDIAGQFQKLGYRFVEIDQEGFVSGKLNPIKIKSV